MSRWSGSTTVEPATSSAGSTTAPGCCDDPDNGSVLYGLCRDTSAATTARLWRPAHGHPWGIGSARSMTVVSNHFSTVSAPTRLADGAAVKAVLHGIGESAVNGHVVLRPVAGSASRRVLYVNSYGKPSLWGKVAAARCRYIICGDVWNWHALVTRWRWLNRCATLLVPQSTTT